MEAAHGERVFEEALVSMMHVKTPPSGLQSRASSHWPAMLGWRIAQMAMHKPCTSRQLTRTYLRWWRSTSRLHTSHDRGTHMHMWKQASRSMEGGAGGIQKIQQRQ